MGFKTSEARQRKSKIEDGERRGDGAFVHLKENGKRKKSLSSGGNCTQILWNKCVCVFFFVHDRKKEERKRAICESGEEFYICAEKINMYLL